MPVDSPRALEHPPGVRALVVGAGASGLLHALSLRAHGVSIEAVYDPVDEQARRLAQVVGGRAATTFDELRASDAEVVAVCGPPRVHASQATVLARPGRVVLLEKPIALRATDLEALAALPGCVPVLQWRFGRALRAVRRAVLRGELGPAPTVTVDLAWRREEDYFARRRDWGCGPLLSIGIHAVDAVLYALADEPATVAASLWRRPDGLESSATVLFTTSRGAAVVLRSTVEASSDATRMAFCGGGLTAVIEGTEEDPTAGAVAWSAAAARLARLRALEAEEPGYTAGPLLVPLVGAALGRDSPGGGAPMAPPTVQAVAPAHRLVLAAYAAAQASEERGSAAGRRASGNWRALAAAGAAPTTTAHQHLISE